MKKMSGICNNSTNGIICQVLFGTYSYFNCLNPRDNPLRDTFFCTEKETEVQRSQVTCPRSLQSK